MILDTLILENFGVYAGRQVADLSPREGRPIILFGGLNGGGKTTMLDALQLVLYGSKARISSRGKLPYKEYLKDSIHRGADLAAGAGISLHFRRIENGVTHHYELRRAWKMGGAGCEESVHCTKDGLHDDEHTKNWDEFMEAYLPGNIAHLFFFDGEQIKELAEGSHAAEILGSAVHSLLGLDLVERLDGDLKVLERRKRAEAVDEVTLRQIEEGKAELTQLDSEEESIRFTEGRLENEAGQLAKKVSNLEASFKREGGELYQRRDEFESQLRALEAEKAAVAGDLRQLASESLPLGLVAELLEEVGSLAQHESEIRQAGLVLGQLAERDQELQVLMRKQGLSKEHLQAVKKHLDEDRSQRKKLAGKPVLLGADEHLSAEVHHLRSAVIPQMTAKSAGHVRSLEAIEEKILQVQGLLARVPNQDAIATLQAELAAVNTANSSKLEEMAKIRVHLAAIARQKQLVGRRVDKLVESNVDFRHAEEDRVRLLRHSEKVRGTLAAFRDAVVRRHVSRLEALMLESFNKLLRKKGLVEGLRIAPATFHVELIGKGGHLLPFDRLSAGERQLLATAMLWALARASGRPVPTMIDTPLGRLDSSHRKNLVERYFPIASHQVILLSTDEEIDEACHSSLKPFIARSYVLRHDDQNGQTHIEPGYFPKA